MSLPSHIWKQLKSITADELINALEKDGFIRDEKQGAQLVYRHADGRICSVHYHPGKTYGPKLLKKLLFDDIGWTEKDFRRLKLIK